MHIQYLFNLPHKVLNILNNRFFKTVHSFTSATGTNGLKDLPFIYSPAL